MKILTFLLDRLKERSTWVGFTSVATAVGITFSPEQMGAIVTAGVAVSGLIVAFTKDKE